MSQTTYNAHISDNAPIRGALADNGPHDVVSRAYEAIAGAAIAFGTPMTFGTDVAKQAKLPVADGAPLLGISVHQHIAPGTPGSEAFDDDDGIEDTQTLDILTKGRIWVKVRVAVTPADPVYFRVTAGPGVVGDWEIADDGTETVLAANCRWLSSADADGLAILEINAP